MGGIVEDIEHIPGSHTLSFSKEAESNEKLRTEFENFSIEQIAGAFARRTHGYLEEGQHVEKGARIGHISFSSRVDFLLPEEYEMEDISVDIGDRVKAGESVLAELSQVDIENQVEPKIPQ
jgi:phosphatidylserine decarboxylase